MSKQKRLTFVSVRVIDILVAPRLTGHLYPITRNNAIARHLLPSWDEVSMFVKRVGVDAGRLRFYMSTIPSPDMQRECLPACKPLPSFDVGQHLMPQHDERRTRRWHGVYCGVYLSALSFSMRIIEEMVLTDCVTDEDTDASSSTSSDMKSSTSMSSSLASGSFCASSSGSLPYVYVNNLLRIPCYSHLCQHWEND